MDLGSAENLEAQQRVGNMGSGIRLPGSEFSALTGYVILGKFQALVTYH